MSAGTLKPDVNGGNGHDLTKGPIGKQLWSLAWPLMLSVFFYILYNLVDAFWVSKVSDDAMAAVSVSQIALFAMVALSMGLTVGSGVIMSMHIGAGDRGEAERVLGQSFVLATIAAFLFTIFSLIFRDEILALSGATGTIFNPALVYFTITAAGSVFLFWLVNIMFAFNAQGDTLSLTWFFATSTTINLILDPILIFGWGPIPEYGIAGAALATLISQAIFVAVALSALANEKRFIRFHFRNLTFRWESVKEVLRIGVPASLTQVINPIGLAALMFVTSQAFYEAGVIAFSVGFRVEFFAMLPALGFGFGAMAMIGQNMGAEQFDRTHRSFNKALLYSFAAATGFGVLVMLCAQLIAGIFTADLQVTQYLTSYIWIIGLSYGLLAASMVEANAFQAIGRSWPGFWIFFIRFFVVSVPLAYVATVIFDFSIVAIWIMIVLGNVVSALVGYVWIKRALHTIRPEDIPVHADPYV